MLIVLYREYEADTDLKDFYTCRKVFITSSNFFTHSEKFYRILQRFLQVVT